MKTVYKTACCGCEPSLKYHNDGATAHCWCSMCGTGQGDEPCGLEKVETTDD